MSGIDFVEKIYDKSLEIDITVDCNIACLNCDRSCGHAPSKEHMSLKQIEKCVNESLEIKWEWEKIKLIGGEPTLHPQFFSILKIIKKYKDANPDCVIQLWTNGFGNEVKKVLSKVPDWCEIINSEKLSPYNIFRSYNMAPIDIAKFKNKDFSNGCGLLYECGIGLNRYGFYPCAAGAAVDRVFGFDIGVKNLSKFLKKSVWKKQLKKLCSYCGNFKYQYEPTFVIKEQLSISWQKAYKKYKREKPPLSLY